MTFHSCGLVALSWIAVNVERLSRVLRTLRFVDVPVEVTNEQEPDIYNIIARALDQVGREAE